MYLEAFFPKSNLVLVSKCQVSHKTEYRSVTVCSYYEIWELPKKKANIPSSCGPDNVVNLFSGCGKYPRSTTDFFHAFSVEETDDSLMQHLNCW